MRDIVIGRSRGRERARQNKRERRRMRMEILIAKDERKSRGKEGE